MTLQDWLANHWLTEHESSAREVQDLLGLVERDLGESQLEDLGLDWSFNLAYNAALQAAKLALHAHGFRAGREAHHERTLESLRYTIGADPRVVRTLQRCRKKRNIVEYDRVGAVSKQERDEMIAMARDLADAVRDWLTTEHPELLDQSSR